MASLEELILLNFDEGDGNSSDDEEETRTSPVRQNAFAASEKAFRTNYRLSKNLCRGLIEEIAPYMQEAYRTSSLSVQTKVLITLNFFATGSYQNIVANHINACVTQPTVSKCVKEVVDALNKPAILNKWMSFPSNYLEMENNSRKFYRMYGLPGVIGCIDCTHVAIHAPPSTTYDEHSYVNRKGYHSINTQLICDADLKIINVNPLFPGGTHDSYIWSQSAVLPIMRGIHSHNGKYYLIGDSGYGMRRWLHTPIPEPQTASEESYNQAFKTARATIERCNGVLKSRFRCLLRHRVLHYLPEKAIQIINSCCILHNMCINANVELEDDEDSNSDYDRSMDYGMDVNVNIPVNSRRNQELIAAEVYRNSIVQNYF